MNSTTYDKLWYSMIAQAEKLVSKHPELFYIDYGLKEKLHNEYDMIRQYTKHELMSNPDSLIDRHKTGAAFMLAILHVPIVQYSVPLSADLTWRINERLAISMGLSILRAFINNDMISDKTKPEEKEKAKLLSDFIKQGFSYPDVTHGKYEDNWALELYYGKNGRLSILSLAHELFLLERYNYALAKSGQPGQPESGE